MHALLLWDEIHTIVPHEGFREVDFKRSVLMERAAAVVERPHAPTPDEHQRVHRRVKALLMNGPKPWMFCERPPNFPHATRYPQTFN